jgi:hypothetical protein
LTCPHIPFPEQLGEPLVLSQKDQLPPFYLLLGFFIPDYGHPFALDERHPVLITLAM